MAEDFFTIDKARKKVDGFEADLEKMIPNPNKQRLLEIGKEYTPAELSDLLQHFGSYIATLSALEGKLEAECHILKEGLKTGLSVMAVKSESKDKTITGREAEVLAANDGLRQIRKMEIENQACLLSLQGWKKAYEGAYVATSRIIAIRLGELTLTTGIHP